MKWLYAALLASVAAPGIAFDGHAGERYHFEGIFCNEIPGVEYLISSANWRGTLKQNTPIPPSCTLATGVEATFLGVERVVVSGNTKYEILKISIENLHPSFYLRFFELPIVQYIFYFDPDYVGA